MPHTPIIKEAKRGKTPKIKKHKPSDTGVCCRNFTWSGWPPTCSILQESYTRIRPLPFRYCRVHKTCKGHCVERYWTRQDCKRYTIQERTYLIHYVTNVRTKVQQLERVAYPQAPFYWVIIDYPSETPFRLTPFHVRSFVNDLEQWEQWFDTERKKLRTVLQNIIAVSLPFPECQHIVYEYLGRNWEQESPSS